MTGGQRQREEELRPIEDEDEERRRQESAPDERESDFDKGFKLAHAMDSGDPLQVHRNLFNEAPDHPNTEGKGEGGVSQDQAEMGVGETQHREQDHHRYHHSDRWKHASTQKLKSEGAAP